jgi:hypothetical protein
LVSSAVRLRSGSNGEGAAKMGDIGSANAENAEEVGRVRRGSLLRGWVVEESVSSPLLEQALQEKVEARLYRAEWKVCINLSVFSSFRPFTP